MKVANMSFTNYRHYIDKIIIFFKFIRSYKRLYQLKHQLKLVKKIIAENIYI